MLNDSSTTAFILQDFVVVEVFDMALVGLLFIGLLIRTFFAAAILVVGVWLLLKVGRLIDAYTEKAKATRTTK